MRPLHRVAAVALAAALAVGCEDRIDRAASEASASTVELPEVRAPGLPVLRSSTRVAIAPGSIDVDQSELVASWTGEARERALAAKTLSWPRVVQPAGFRLQAGDVDRPGSYMLPRLHAALLEAAQLEKQRAQVEPNAAFAGRLTVLAARQTPYDLLTRVLYTAGQAEYGTWDLALASTGRRVAITVEAPRIGDHEELGCAGPLLAIGRSGVQVRAGGRQRGVPGVVTAPPRWSGAVMLGPTRACPSVPRRAGKHDRDALLALLREMTALAPRCSWAVVTATPETTWEDLASVLEVLQAETTYPHLTLGVTPDDEPPICAQALRPNEAR